MLQTLRGLARSIAVYHLDFPKRRRSRSLFGTFVSPGDLVFDVGAHTGGRVGCFRSLDARVVAVEPNPALLAMMRLLFGRDRNVAIEPIAVSKAKGTMPIHYSTGNPMLTTLAGDWVREARTTSGFTNIVWDRVTQVEVTTLDDLIAKHGAPAFCKIDVEAAEVDVLAGLSTPIPGLSFEFLNGQQHRASDCLELLEKLGNYEYAISPDESFRFIPDRWLNAAEVVEELAALPETVGSGDIYARLIERKADP